MYYWTKVKEVLYSLPEDREEDVTRSFTEEVTLVLFRY